MELNASFGHVMVAAARIFFRSGFLDSHLFVGPTRPRCVVIGQVRLGAIAGA